MRQDFKDIPLEPVTEGMISESVLSHYVVPKGAVSYLENFHNDTLGILTSRRPFVSQLTPGAAVLSCVLYQSPSGTPLIFWQEGSTTKQTSVPVAGGVTSYANTASTSAPARYDTVQGVLLITPRAGVNEQPRAFNNSGAPALLASTTFPNNSFDIISGGFAGRIWMASSQDALNRVYYTDVIPAAGVTSSTGGTEFLTINANGTDRITGFARTQNVLYVFTHNGIFRIYSTQSQDNTPLINVGAFSQEGIVRAKNGFYFYHPSGIYFIGSNGAPQEISIKVRDWIQKVKNSNQSKVFGWCDDDHVYFSLGSALQGEQADKCFYLRYTISTQVWTLYSTFGFLPSCAASAFFGNSVAIDSETNDIYPLNYIMGTGMDASGVANTNYYAGTINVYVPATAETGVVTDFGAFPLFVDMQTTWQDFEIETILKRIDGMALSSENGAGLKLEYQTDKDDKYTWKPVDFSSIKSSYVTLYRDFQSRPFNRIKFRVSGQTSGPIVKLGKMSVLSIDELGYEEN